MSCRNVELDPTAPATPQKSPSASENIKPAKPCEISSIVSSPQPAPACVVSFRQLSLDEMTALRKPASPLSPPISPCSRAAVPALRVHHHDQALYRRSQLPQTPPANHESLFSPSAESLESHSRTIDEHIASRDERVFRHMTPPTKEEYGTVLTFRSAVFEIYMKNPKALLRHNKAELKTDNASRRSVSLSHTNAGNAPLAPALKQRSHKAPKQPVRSAAKTAKSHVKPTALCDSATRVQKAKLPRTVRASPANCAAASAMQAGLTPEPRARTQPQREDKDYVSLKDVSPPLDSLSTEKNPLKVEWKGNALDLSTDPDRCLLHPYELQLAASLRLDCATYLTTKRRIFLRRLECAILPKAFRKTDAQQACKIDVNKASKLHMAYDKAGWLGIEWMRPHMDTDAISPPQVSPGHQGQAHGH